MAAGAGALLVVIIKEDFKDFFGIFFLPQLIGTGLGNVTAVTQKEQKSSMPKTIIGDALQYLEYRNCLLYTSDAADE